MLSEILLQSGSLSGTNATDTAYLFNGSSTKLRVKSVNIVPKTGVSTDASNYITTTVKKGSTTVASHTTNSTGGSALAAGTPKNLSLAAGGKDLELDSGEVLALDVSKNGTGPTYNHQVFVTCELIRS